MIRRAPGASAWTQFLELKSAADANQTEFLPFTDSAAAGHVTHLRILAQVADDDDFVD